jgi:shikimate kinase
MLSLDRILALVGLSGSGKSTVGALLARTLQAPLRDTDQMIVERAGRTIASIFAEAGEAAFRDLETATLQRACAGGICVLATGGGIVVREANRILLRQHAYVVWLDAPTETLVARLSAHDEERPLLQGDAVQRLETLRRARMPLYEAAADIRIQTAGKHPEDLCEAIVAWLNRKHVEQNR